MQAVEDLATRTWLGTTIVKIMALRQQPSLLCAGLILFSPSLLVSIPYSLFLQAISLSPSPPPPFSLLVTLPHFYKFRNIVYSILHNAGIYILDIYNSIQWANQRYPFM
jgi:hypothetical protein